MTQQTYRIRASRATHTRAATCDEVDCAHRRDGWRSMIDERSELGARQAHYIRSGSGRAFVETVGPTGLTVFDFPADQRCFTEHRIGVDREPFYLLGRRRFDRPDQWVDHFATHQDRLASIVERG